MPCLSPFVVISGVDAAAAATAVVAAASKKGTTKEWHTWFTLKAMEICKYHLKYAREYKAGFNASG